MSFSNVSGWNRHKFSTPCDLYILFPPTFLWFLSRLRCMPHTYVVHYTAKCPKGSFWRSSKFSGEVLISPELCPANSSHLGFPGLSTPPSQGVGSCATAWKLPREVSLMASLAFVSHHSSITGPHFLMSSILKIVVSVIYFFTHITF